jgi:NRPS condensation-like uncharacterized protein
MKYTAEAFDQMQLLWDIKRFNDHQLRCVLRFECALDAETLRRAVVASIEAFPILGTRYIGGTRPHWASLDRRDYDRAFVVAQNEVDFEKILVSKVDEAIGPQVNVCLLNSRPFSIALKLNHMVCDAADFKTYLYLLCGLYAGVLPDGGDRPAACTEDRSVRRILKRFGLGTRLKSVLLQSNENNHSGGIRFPLNGSGPTQPFVLIRKIGRERAAALKDCGKRKGATLNDVVLTVFYRCLFRRLAVRAGTQLRVPVMVDMRRYLAKSEHLSSLTNLTSTVSTHLDYRPENCFDDTLGSVKTIMDRRKRSNLGLNGFVKLDRTYRILGDRIANRLLRSVLKHPLISMTNMGILDSGRLWFGDRRPCDAFLCGSIKYKPYFQLALSSYDGELTLSANLVGSNDDRDRILSFFDEMEIELSAWELSQRAALRADADQKQQAVPV